MEQTPGGLITNWNGFISLGKIDREREREGESIYYSTFTILIPS